DADSEGEEGKFYVWRYDDIEEVAGTDHARLFVEIYGVTPEGNLEGHKLLKGLNALELRDPKTERRLAEMREKLFQRRGARVRPGFDDKELGGWNRRATASL